MKRGRILFEFCVRVIAWVGVIFFGIHTVRQIIHQIFPEDTVVAVLFWIFFSAIIITGYFDICRFIDRIKAA
jgi:hypothetical protein